MRTAVEIIRVRNTSGSWLEKWLYRMLRAVCGTRFNHVAVKIVFEKEFVYYLSPVRIVRLAAGDGYEMPPNISCQILAVKS